MWLPGQWFTEPCSGQLSTALTLQKACGDQASQLRDGFAGSIQTQCRESENIFQNFISNSSVHGGDKTEVNRTYISRVKYEDVVRLCCMIMDVLPGLKGGKLTLTQSLSNLVI